jgi:hypothetical protein
VVRPDAAGREAVEAFLAWLRSEVRRDGELELAVPRQPKRPAGTPAQKRRNGARAARA